MDFSKLFKLGDKNILEDTEKINLEGKEDEEIRKIILDNFPKLFPRLELYSEGNEYTIPVFKKNKKPDSLAFCESEKRLYIFEYKSRIDEDLVEQVRKYRDALQKSNSNLLDLILKWNKQFNKHRKLEDFKENKAKIICIAPEFDDYAIGVEEEWEEDIYLIKITKYKDKKRDLFVLLQTKEENSEILNSSNSIRGINKLKEWINQKIEPLTAEKSLIMKEVRKGVCWDFSKTNQKTPILSIWFKNKSDFYPEPTIFLVNPSAFLVKEFRLNLIRKKNSYYKGTHFYPIKEEKNKDGLIRAEQLITEFIKEKS